MAATVFFPGLLQFFLKCYFLIGNLHATSKRFPGLYHRFDVHSNLHPACVLILLSVLFVWTCRAGLATGGHSRVWYSYERGALWLLLPFCFKSLTVLISSQFGHHLLNAFPFSSTPNDIAKQFSHVFRTKRPLVKDVLTRQTREVLALQLEMWATARYINIHYFSLTN